MINRSYTVRIRENDNLYQSINPTTDTNNTFPAFFATSQDVAMIYNRVNPNNICKVFKNHKQRILISVGFDNPEFDKMIPSLKFKYNEERIVFKNILNVFFGTAKNIEDVLQSIFILKEQLPFIKKIIDYTNNYNRRQNIYAGFNRSDIVIRDMNKVLDTYRDKITNALLRNNNITILPSRTTDRNWDLLFCNLMKIYSLPLGIHGFHYKPDSFDTLEENYSRNMITLNEIIRHRGSIVPEEICLLEGYKFLEVLGLCNEGNRRSGGTRIRKNRRYRSKTRKQKNRRYRSKTKGLRPL